MYTVLCISIEEYWTTDTEKDNLMFPEWRALIEKVMQRLSIEAKRIVSLYSFGYYVPSIIQRLKQEKVGVSKCAIYDLIWCWSFISKTLHVNWTCVPYMAVTMWLLNASLFHAWLFYVWYTVNYTRHVRFMPWENMVHINMWRQCIVVFSWHHVWTCK